MPAKAEELIGFCPTCRVRTVVVDGVVPNHRMPKALYTACPGTGKPAVDVEHAPTPKKRGK